MTQLVRNPAYMFIEDVLDAVGQKYRVVCILRGCMLWTAAAALSSGAAAVAAHIAGPGRLSSLILVAWMAWLAGSGAWWLLRPLVLKPRPLHVARLVEERVGGLHNGLTNGVLLAQASDLHSSPWLPVIFDEIVATIRAHPVQQSVGLSDLRRLATWWGALLLILAGLLCIPGVPAILMQGWRQMLNPTRFVPKVGAVRILEVEPRSITLVSGQPLEITAVAEDPRGGQPQARLIFDNQRIGQAVLDPLPGEGDRLRYAYRMNRVEESMRWRVEIGDTQSDWCDVKVVRQVKLQEIALNISPPAYTRRESQSLVIAAADLGKTPLAVLEGSRVELSAVVDVPVRSALLQMDQETPLAMNVSQGGLRFTQNMVVMRGCEAAVLLTEGGQVVAKVPDPPLKVGCTRDAAPTIEMKWPAQDTAVAPRAELKIHAVIRDDHGVSSARVLMSTAADQPLAPVCERPFEEGTTVAELMYVLNVPDSARVHGNSVRVQIEAADNRNLAGLVGAGYGAPTSARDTGPQTSASPIYEIKFRDPDEIARQQQEQFDRLRQLLLEMLRKQQGLHAQAVAWKPPSDAMAAIHSGQTELRATMHTTAETFPFEPDDKVVQKTLLVLYHNTARDAVDLARAAMTEKIESEQARFNRDLQAKQRRIIEVLESLISRLNLAAAPTTQPGKKGGDLDAEKEKFRELAEELRKFIAEEKRILDATAHLAKKPVDNFDDNDKKLLEELKMAQEKLDAFMQEKISDFSKLAEQDMANASLLKEMLEVYSEVTMAKDALKKQAVEMAIPLEEMGLELAKSLESNLEKWLWDQADRQRWNQEDPVGKVDVPMAELPNELEDMVGELFEQQEDLFEEMEDTAANWADSLDKGAGWDAMDGPIANMSAKGVTGNQLPNNNEMNGRSGEGRSGKSSGEFVEETASGKGGRNTPTRLDPTPFQQGQIKDESKDPVGGATGGGKISGQGGAGLEGPVPPKDLRDKMERLASKQAELRNKGERIALDPKYGRYDSFKLLEAVALMRRVESDIRANRYQTALRRRDMLLDRLETSHMLLSGQIHTQKDTSPTMSDRLEDQINDVINGQLPAAWQEALREYYRKLGQQ